MVTVPQQMTIPEQCQQAADRTGKIHAATIDGDIWPLDDLLPNFMRVNPTSTVRPQVQCYAFPAGWRYQPRRNGAK